VQPTYFWDVVPKICVRNALLLPQKVTSFEIATWIKNTYNVFQAGPVSVTNTVLYLMGLTNQEPFHVTEDGDRTSP
jgi:hypothetical protein